VRGPRAYSPLFQSNSPRGTHLIPASALTPESIPTRARIRIMHSASVSSRPAPANSLSRSTPLSSSRALTNSFETRFMPSNVYFGLVAITSPCNHVHRRCRIARLAGITVAHRLQRSAAGRRHLQRQPSGSFTFFENLVGLKRLLICGLKVRFLRGSPTFAFLHAKVGSQKSRRELRLAAKSASAADRRTRSIPSRLHLTAIDMVATLRPRRN
jgi:hypothetical protein